MILYHFTSYHLVEKIRREGLTRGMIPWAINPKNGRVVRHHGYQWLTSNAAFDDQTWCLLGNSPIARNGYRVTVAIPNHEQRKVVAWPEFARRMHPECEDDFNSISGSGDWKLFVGVIPTTWFLEVKRNAGLPFRPDEMILGGG